MDDAREPALSIFADVADELLASGTTCCVARYACIACGFDPRLFDAKLLRTHLLRVRRLA